MKLGLDFPQSPVAVTRLYLEKRVLSDHADVEDAFGRVVSHFAAGWDFNVDLADRHVTMIPRIRLEVSY